MAISTRFRKIRDDFSLAPNKLYDGILGHESKHAINSISLTWHKAVDFSVFDDKGNQWIDLTSGIFLANAGHSNPRVKQAIKDQVDKDLLFAYNYPTDVRYAFVSKLLALSPSHFDRVVLLNSGTEALDLAYKRIKYYGNKHKKRYLITFKGAYHGRGLSNEFISGDKEKVSWSHLVDDDVVFLDFPYDTGSTFDEKKLPPGAEIAGFVIETFQGWGVWFYPQKYIEALYLFARKHGALICFDELQAGFYRTGPIYGYMTYGEHIQPDIICLGKGISSSLPISAVLTRKELVESEVKTELFGTQSGNPVCCAAALANLEFLSDPTFMKTRIETEKVFKDEISKLGRHKVIKQINMRGMVAGLIFEKPKMAKKIVLECIKNGVLAIATSKGSIKIGPPLTITPEAIRECVEVMDKIIGAMVG